MRSAFMLCSAFVFEQLEILHLSPGGFLGRAELIKIWAAEKRGNWSVCCFFLFQKRQDNDDDARCYSGHQRHSSYLCWWHDYDWWQNKISPKSDNGEKIAQWCEAFPHLPPCDDDMMMIMTMVMTQWCTGCLLPSWHIPPRASSELRGHPTHSGSSSSKVSLIICIIVSFLGF